MLEFGPIQGLRSEVEIKPTNEYNEKPKDTRLFGLKTAPTVYPTESEFADPYEFIKSIEKLGSEYGIVKVVPPVSWRPKFRLSTGTLFKTRRQQLSSMGAVTRASTAWLDRMSKFHLLESGRNIVKQPLVNGKKLNYYKLKCVVDSLGGAREVARTQCWPIVCAKLELSLKDDLETAHHVFNQYKMYIAPFEEYLNQVMRSGKFDDMIYKEQKDQLERKSIITPPPEREPTIPSTTVATPTRRSSRRLKGDSRAADEDEDFENRASKRRKLNRSVGARTERHGDLEAEESDSENTEEVCSICEGDGTAELKCKYPECERIYHYDCLGSSLALYDRNNFPQGNKKWYCPRCLVGTGEFYFDEGEEYTLDEFKDKADEFRESYFQENLDLVDPAPGKTDRNVLENLVEERFWSHVDDVDCDIAVEYGADIHTDVKGSGFPTITNHARDPYSKDGWNLNNFAKHKKSLFSMIKDISGVTTPWGYIGMMFSTFCWHSEDHYTYSINYQHCGNTKTWYGIPGACAEQFEAASRSIVPELFAKQPDILFQRATMISPSVIAQHNVPVYACDQHAGQFVITFPKAYHCGFNHGFNYNEAVNYAPPEWVPYGQECIISYRIQNRIPLFSHDKLLLSVAYQDQSSDTAKWLYPHLIQLAQQEDADRKRVKRLFPNVSVELIQTDASSDNIYQCSKCKTISYLSRIVVFNQDVEEQHRVFCLNHLPDPSSLPRGTQITLEMREYSRNLRKLCADVQARID